MWNISFIKLSLLWHLCNVTTKVSEYVLCTAVQFCVLNVRDTYKIIGHYEFR